MTNQTAMQYFEWYLPSDGQHWNNLAEDAQHLADLGISHVWMPPAFKATNKDDVGYGVYDLFDLGEFDQKEQSAPNTASKKNISMLSTNSKKLVLYLWPTLCLITRRQRINLRPSKWSKLTQKTVPKRSANHLKSKAGHISPLTDAIKPTTILNGTGTNFNGTDFDAKRNKSGIYLIQGDNKGWADNDLVDNENGNFDYLMYANLDYKHPEVIENIYEWADWFVETTGVQGFRMDAVKHIDSFFMRNFIRDVKENKARISMSLVNFGMVTRRITIPILKRLKNVLTSSMFPSTTIYTTLAQRELIMI